MSLVELLAQPVAQQLTLTLAHFLWQGLAVLVILALLVELLGIRRPQARYACSLAALLVMLACPAITFWWLGGSEEGAAGRISHPHYLSIAAFAGGPETRPTDHAAAQFVWLELAQPYALAAWLIGVSLFAGRLLAGAIGVWQLRQKLIPLPLDLAGNVERLGRRLVIDALPLVFLSRKVSEAMAVGIVRPLVLIPASWATEMPLDMLEAVIAHELAHLKRRDLLVNLLQRIGESLLFYHPAVWWLSRRLRQERELCADALAVAATGRRLEYAEALEQVARLRQADVGPALAALMRGGKNMRLLERVRNVLGLAGGTDRSRLWPAGLLILALPLGLWIALLGLTAAVADEDREEGDRPRVEREVEDEDDAREQREAKEDDDDDDEQEGRREKEEDDDDDDDEKEGKRGDDDDDDDDDDKADKKFFGKEEREDGDDDEKEGRRDGEVKKEGPRDGDAPKKEGARDGDVVKKGPRDGDAPKKEGAREPGKKIVKKEGSDNLNAIIELKSLVSKLMAENERLRAELAAARGGKEFGIKKEGGEKESAFKKEGVKPEGKFKKEVGPEERAAAERKEAQLREKKEAVRRAEEEREEVIRDKRVRAAAEEREAAARKQKERAAAESEEAEAREAKERAAAAEEKEAAAKQDKEDDAK